MAAEGRAGRPDLGALRIDESKRGNGGEPGRRRWLWVVVALAVVAVGAFVAIGLAAAVFAFQVPNMVSTGLVSMLSILLLVSAIAAVEKPYVTLRLMPGFPRM